ncbi:hypothetical protein Taro_000480 [Colocasia esculenta]|uniref:Uncharacterized protein n=1 Tax=Colocasia esculenta TaxID=4460 RepID=A0A843TC82_COLES|nr:hypothetical protein [Colocasia esculenta]
MRLLQPIRSHLSTTSTYLSTGILLPEPSQYKTSSSYRHMAFTCRQMFIACRQPTLVIYSSRRRDIGI